ncbi:ParA family protein [Tautonia plasticadhaerens]|uniref:MinD/ParA/CobQ/CobA-like protein n=1 Tax=Tautonia plasticadhaerens TaxID=2527974 RepID=A0A518H840_9BACT|nr:AAA family ATPase [Tautonia plasticadhaerens]QDV36961.1 MinD/ParA/CobQ/CobA-like protein [Tautonia plasticadhaerens]
MPPIVVSLINLKGGVGKTTTTVQLAECLVSEYGKRVLVIDLDPQTNATISLIEEERWEELDDQGLTIFQLFQDKLDGTSVFDIRRAIQRGVSNLGLDGLSLLPSSIRLINVQDRMSEIPVKLGYAITPMEVLKAAIHDVPGQFDYVLIDCPPNLGFITRNGIEISDYFFIPTIPDTLSTYGIPQIVKSIEQFSRERPLLKIRCLGLVVTKFYSRSEAHVRGINNLPARFTRVFAKLGLPPAPIFKTVIPLANTFADVPLTDNKPKSFKEKYGRSRSGDRYLYQYVIDLTKEFMDHAGR